MKKITIKNCIMLALLTIIAPIMALSSCSKDDDGDINVKKGRRLLMVESQGDPVTEDNYIFHYEYDDVGRLSGIITESPSGSIYTAWFTYDEHQLSWDYGSYSEKALISDSRVQWLEPRGIYFKYDSKGRIQECISENGRHIQFVWEDDNIVKLVASLGEVTLKYTKIKAFDLAYQEAFNPLCVFGQQLNTYKWADHFVYYTGLCGPFSKNMPSEMTWIANERYATGYHRQGILTYEYTTDSSGFPVGAVIKNVWDGGKERPKQAMTMTWK